MDTLDCLQERWPRDHKGRIQTTYSMWSTWLSCRCKCYLRYGLGLVRKKEDRAALWLGSLVHRALQVYYSNNNNIEVAKAAINQVGMETDMDNAPLLVARAHAMIHAYHKHYASDLWTPAFVEATFSGPIQNPKTRRNSLALSMAGKMDLGCCPDRPDELWIMEHKTVDEVSEDKLRQIWTYFQTKLYYAYFAHMDTKDVRTEDFRAKGIIYNWIGRTRVREKKGETEEEFQERKRKLEARTKKKSRAKRQSPSTPTEIYDKVLEKLTDEPHRHFHRERVLFDEREIQRLLDMLWEMEQDFLHCKRKKRWYQNTGHCFRYGKPCPYYPICDSNGNPNLIRELYEIQDANQELEEDQA